MDKPVALIGFGPAARELWLGGPRPATKLANDFPIARHRMKIVEILGLDIPKAYRV
jgi:hypothetical protein